MRHRIALATAAATLAVGTAVTTAVRADGNVEVVASFTSAGELPEGIALDRRGNAYVSLGPPFFVGSDFGAVQRIAPDGERTTLVEFPEGPAPAGLAVDAFQRVYFAVPDLTGVDVGVYRITRDGAERIPGTETMVVPNGLAIGPHGEVFASDSILGQIWRMPRGGDARTWIADDLLAGCGDLPGANGVAFWRGDLYVANTGKGMLVKIPVAPDGSPGEPEIVAGDDDCASGDLFGIDGIAFDVEGNVYAALVLVNQLVRIDPSDGTVTVLLDGSDGLWNPASVDFGTRWGDRTNLYITNYAVPDFDPGLTPNLGPAVLKVDVGVRGQPLPSQPLAWLLDRWWWHRR